MQTNDKTGIGCDYCGTTYNIDFEYYSFDFFSYNSVDGRKPSIEQIIKSQAIFSLDICTSCFDKIGKVVIGNYSKNMSKHRRMNVPAFCDWTGAQMSGTFDAYYCAVTKVKVSLSKQPNICVKCEAKTFDDDKQCSKCSGTDFTKIADITTASRYLEINLCSAAYDHFVDKAKTIRVVASEWATRS